MKYSVFLFMNAPKLISELGGLHFTNDPCILRMGCNIYLKVDITEYRVNYLLAYGASQAEGGKKKVKTDLNREKKRRGGGMQIEPTCESRSSG